MFHTMAFCDNFIRYRYFPARERKKKKEIIPTLQRFLVDSTRGEKKEEGHVLLTLSANNANGTLLDAATSVYMSIGMHRACRNTSHRVG